jgi:hypothetical protein
LEIFFKEHKMKTPLSVYPRLSKMPVPYSRKTRITIVLAVVVMLMASSFPITVSASPATAQTTSFAYTGQLSLGGLPVSGDYDFEFKLFDDLSSGAQQGATLQRLNVTVQNGVYTVTLDYGAAVFTGDDRFLEICYRVAGGGGAFTVLSPRQQVLSVPYAIKSLSAASSDTLSPGCVNCVSSSQIGSVNGNAVTGTIPLASLPAGSSRYIQNTTSQQFSANFNISGTGTAGAFNAATQYNIGGNPVLRIQGWSLLVGVNAGGSSTIPYYNSIFGTDAGAANTAGQYNSFFGGEAGKANTEGHLNTFFGYQAGLKNTESSNAFFGARAGRENTTGTQNAFFGTRAGDSNTVGSDNSIFGYQAGSDNTTGARNTFVGSNAGTRNTTGNDNAFFGAGAGEGNSGGNRNAFFGFEAGGSNSTGDDNAFFGTSSGRNNGSGNNNAFFGTSSGYRNTTGSNNTFFGTSSGNQNTTGSNNTFFGRNAGYDNTTGQGNAFFGKEAGFHNSGNYNAFFGLSAGASNTNGGSNAFFGYYAGQGSTTGTFNAFFGAYAGNSNTTGYNNTIIGPNADVTTGNLSYATAIGAGASVSNSNTVVLGRSSDGVRIPGSLTLTTLGSAGSTLLCRNASNQLATCSSSLRYKTEVRPFTSGLDIVKRLRPITFTWRDGAMLDVGFGAEEVEKIEPLLATRNERGEIEGVKYAQLTTVLVNAVNEQQAQMEQYRKQLAAQQSEIAALKQLLCHSHPKAAVCQSAKRPKR